MELVGVALDRQRAVEVGVRSRGRRRAARPPPAPRRDLGPGRPRCGPRAGRRRRGRAGSRSATSRDIRLVEPSAESTAWRSSSGVRRASPGAARGSPGRWSAGCAARARRRRRTRAGARRRARARCGPRRGTRASRPSSRPARRPRRRRPGSASAGRGRGWSVMSRARAVSAAIGRIARSATARPASSARMVPPRTPAARKSQRRSMVASTSSSGSAYWMKAGPAESAIGSLATSERARVARSSELGAPRSDRGSLVAASGRAELVDDPDHGVLGHRRVGEAGPCDHRRRRSGSTPTSVSAASGLGGAAQLVVEVVADPVADEVAEHERRRRRGSGG